MERAVLWGCGDIGVKAYEKLKDNYKIVAFGDNDIYKQNLIYRGIPVISFDKMVREYNDCEVIVSMRDYYEEAKSLSNRKIRIIGYYDSVREKVLPWQKITWDDLERMQNVQLYAGDIYGDFDKYPDNYVICLSLTESNYRTIRHDITSPYPLKANSIDSYQIEDVVEHIAIKKIIPVLNEIYRILKQGGYLRLSLPDYHTPALLERSFLDKDGKVIFDPKGGGKFLDGEVCEGGHIWFPTYELVKEILKKSNFNDYKFYRYRDIDGKLWSEEIDYSLGYISRTKEHATFKEDVSIVVDCFK